MDTYFYLYFMKASCCFTVLINYYAVVGKKVLCNLILLSYTEIFPGIDTAIVIERLLKKYRQKLALL